MVVDPRPGLKEIIPKVKAALEGGINAIQLWNKWEPAMDHKDFISEICKLSHQFEVPVLVNENWQWLKTFPLDGVHFDAMPEDVNYIRREIGKDFLVGITCGNDETRIRWGIVNNVDYISFCSIFPSSTSKSCELVSPEIIQATRERTSIPIYAAGGITFENAPLVLNLGVDGIAIVSEIMKAEDPKLAVNRFKQCFTHKIKPEF